MATDRPYRKALSHEAIIEEVKKHSGSQFHPKVVEAYFKMLEKQKNKVRFEMFIEALIFAVIIGYILKGNIKNLENVDIKKAYLVFISFFIEFFIIIIIRKGIVNIGIFTYILDFIMYILLVIFIYLNRKQ